MCVSDMKFPSREAIKTVVLAIVLGMLLPSTDAGGDIRLGIRLYMNGHPKWAFLVLAPVFVNTFFTIVSCRQIEKRGACWFLYLPLVLLQLYPQFCIARLIIKLCRGKIDLKAFISARDSMDGGIGCVEPYCESVPQVYIQTALFAYVQNIDSIVTRLCYSDKSQPCAEYDVCDKFYKCDDDPFATGYQRYLRIQNYTKAESNSTERLEECLNLFRNCISSSKTNMTSTIMGLDESQLYKHISQPLLYLEHPLVQQNGATLDDLKVIHMHRLIIGEYWFFISTYIISILAAAYGVSKFFRLGHARLSVQMLSKRFAFISIISTTFFVLKGVVLASIVMDHGNSLLESTLWWVFFTNLPTTLLVVVFTIIKPCYRLYKQFGGFSFDAVANMLLKQPSLILAPHVTSYFFTLSDDVRIADTVPAKLVNRKNMKNLSCIGNYSFSPKLTAFNAILTSMFTVVLLSFKCYWITNGWEIFFTGLVAICLLRAGFMGYKYIDGLYNLSECIEHNIDQCLECSRVNGFYLEEYKYFEACKDHENKEPYRYKTRIETCEKCNIIKIRCVPFRDYFN